MKLSCFLVFFLLWVVNSFRTSATVPDSLLTERTIRSIYVNYPDSALRLLDEAEKSPASGIIPFRIDLLRAMCYEIKHDLTAKEICVRRALQNDSIRLVPERKLSSIAMLANILERQNRYEESIGVCHEGIDLARNLACKKEELIESLLGVNKNMVLPYFSGLNVSYVLSSKKILISVIFLGGLSL